MVYARLTVKKICGRCGVEYEEHQDYNDKGIKLCIKCFIEFFNEQTALKRNKNNEI